MVALLDPDRLLGELLRRFQVEGIELLGNDVVVWIQGRRRLCWPARLLARSAVALVHNIAGANGRHCDHHQQPQLDFAFHRFARHRLYRAQTTHRSASVRYSYRVPSRPWALDREEKLCYVVTEDEVLSALKQCYDPEIPVNIVDLGLIYGVRFDPAPEEKQDVTVEMTLTAQGCPSHVQIGEQVKARVEQMPGVRNATVNVVWTPPWTPERLSPDARKTLGIE